MIRRLRFELERGGQFTARLLPDVAPQTVRSVLSLLPLEVTVYHTRWCGREVYFPVTSGLTVPRENQTSTSNFGDVIYWKEWDQGEKAAEALSFYYGAEVIRDHRGFLQVNVFARVPEAEWPVIEEVGLRVWQHGIEKMHVTAIEEES